MSRCPPHTAKMVTIKLMVEIIIPKTALFMIRNGPIPAKYSVES